MDADVQKTAEFFAGLPDMMGFLTGMTVSGVLYAMESCGVLDGFNRSPGTLAEK